MKSGGSGSGRSRRTASSAAAASGCAPSRWRPGPSVSGPAAESEASGPPSIANRRSAGSAGGCLYVCPACQLRCTYTEPDKAICGGCANLSPPCVEKEPFHDMMCYMEPCVACEIKKE